MEILRNPPPPPAPRVRRLNKKIRALRPGQSGEGTAEEVRCAVAYHGRNGRECRTETLPSGQLRFWILVPRNGKMNT